MPTILKESKGFTFTIVIVDVHLWSNEGLRVYKCLMPTSGGYNGTVMRLQMFNIKHIDGSKDTTLQMFNIKHIDGSKDTNLQMMCDLDVARVRCFPMGLMPTFRGSKGSMSCK